MKKTYTTPKVRYIDFTYDEHITAASDPSGDIGLVGDPNQVGLCQQMDKTKCLAFWLDGIVGTTCREEPRPWSLRG